VLSFFPHGEITAYPDLKEPNFKATVQLYWTDSDAFERASGSQLILYPAYPEVRLSGFLAGCKLAPAAHLMQIPKEKRRGYDGRVLVFGTTGDGRILAHLAPAGTAMANELLARFASSSPAGLFLELTLAIGSAQNKSLVLAKLRCIHVAGFHESCRLDKSGKLMQYKALNGGGYTLEALLGIVPNGYSEPDYLGWEIKAHSTNRVTLMTPEPNGGIYRDQGAKAFVERYGHAVDNGAKYFTGTHKVGVPCVATGMTMQVKGFDAQASKIVDVAGAVTLIDANGNLAASWAFAHLLTHWNKKHAFAAYVQYSSRKDPLAYKYNSPVMMGEHTDFPRYLKALCGGLVVFDPGSKVTLAGTAKSKVKARSQFRVNVGNLDQLYQRLTVEDISAKE